MCRQSDSPVGSFCKVIVIHTSSYDWLTTQLCYWTEIMYQRNKLVTIISQSILCLHTLAKWVNGLGSISLMTIKLFPWQPKRLQQLSYLCVHFHIRDWPPGLYIDNELITRVIKKTLRAFSVSYSWHIWANPHWRTIIYQWKLAFFVFCYFICGGNLKRRECDWEHHG